VNDGEKLGSSLGGGIWLQCQLVNEKCIDVGDHVIVVGKVVEGGEYSGAEDEGLIYWKGEYRTIPRA